MINKLLFLIFAGGAVIGLFPNPASGSDAFSVATIPFTPELKPASSFKLAAVCFAGSDDCGSQGLFNRVGEDEVITMDPEKQCLAEGYSKNICNNGQIVKDPCRIMKIIIKAAPVLPISAFVPAKKTATASNAFLMDRHTGKAVHAKHRSSVVIRRRTVLEFLAVVNTNPVFANLI